MKNSQFVTCPIEIVRSGKNLSASAFRIYMVIFSYNPAFPGIRRIAKESGLSTRTVQKAIRELETKRLIYCISGKAHFLNNEYKMTAPTAWKLCRKGVVPSTTPPPKKCGTRYHDSVVPSTTGGVVLGTKELDQYESDQIIIGEWGAALYPTNNSEGRVESSENGSEKRSPNGFDHTAGRKGVGLTADDLEKRRSEQKVQLLAIIESEKKEITERPRLE